MVRVPDPHQITQKSYYKVNALQYVSRRFGCHYLWSGIVLVNLRWIFAVA
jgi:hypothetical protein